MEQSMHTIFLKRFLLFIVVPILILLCIGSALMVHTVEKDGLKNQEIMLNSFEESLEQEVSDGAFRLAQFLLTNNQQMMNLMIDYYTDNTALAYYDYIELNESLSFLTSVNLRVEGIEFYYTNGEIYSHKSYGLLSYEEVQTRTWYLQAKAVPNQIEVGIDLASDFISNVSGSEKNTKKDLFFVLSPDNYDYNDQLDVVFMLVECSTFDSLLELDGTDYSAYIINSDGEILFESDSRYTERIEQEGIDNLEDSIVALSVNIELTDWELILVRDVGENTQIYLQGICVIILIILIFFVAFFIYSRDFLRTIAEPVSCLASEMNRLNLETNKIKVQEEVPYEIRRIQEQYNEMLDRIQNLVNENQEKEYARYKEELKALQLQINPHFLSNTLNTIKFMAQVAKFDGIRDMTDSLMQIMDCSFRNHDSLHSLAQEKDILEAYGYIMKIRYAESFDIIIHVAEDCESYLIPKLLLQPFIENALFHGLEEYADEGIVEVQICKEDEQVKIVIQDNGRGMTDEMISKIYQGYETKEGRVGIANVMRRLKLYYEDACEFHVFSELGKGTKFEISIPIQEEEKCIQ